MPVILSDTAIKKARPKEKRYRLPDTQGLYLEVAPNGSKWWRLRYSVNGKETMMSLGVYPQVTLKMARERRDEARKHIASGKDPKQIMWFEREEDRGTPSTPTFSTIAKQWHEFKSKNWGSTTTSKMLLRLSRCIGAIPDKPFNELELEDFLPFLKEMENRGKFELCHIYAQICSQICNTRKSLSSLTTTHWKT